MEVQIQISERNHPSYWLKFFSIKISAQTEMQLS